MKVSVIVCYNKPDLFQEMQKYVENQTIYQEVEVIGIDNSQGRFKSAAAALNYGSDIANGEILVWAHQDVFLDPTNALESIYEYLIAYNGLCLLGVAGVQRGAYYVLSAITEGRERKEIFKDRIFKPEFVDSVDECLMAMKRSDWQSIRFDEKVCDDWHFYGVDLSMAVKVRGGQVVCFPIKVCHISGGTLSYNFHKTLIQLAKKYKHHRKDLPRITSTCVDIKNRVCSARYRMLVYKVKKILKIK